jgi:dTDP-4-amino-4,6-dideoxygalactose transaminase
VQIFHPQFHVEEVLAELRPVLNSGWVGPGPKCKQFEEEFNKFTSAKHSHFVHSATAALHIALRISNPKGKKVLTTPLTFCSTNAVILYENLEPVFVDINDTDLSLDANDLCKKKNESGADTVMWVHYGGNISSYFDFIPNLFGGEIKVIEDCAHAMGAFYSNGQRVGSNPNSVSCFSMQAVKNCPTADSGIIVVPNEEMLDRAKRLAWLGIDKDTYARTNSSESEIYKWKYSIDELGIKANGNDVMATIALVQFKYLDRDNAYRKQIADWYVDNFQAYGNKIKTVYHNRDSSHHLFVIRVNNRDEVIKALKDNGIAPGVHYLPNYEFPVFSKFYTKGSCPNCEQISKEIISLPNHLLLTKKDIDRVCEVVINASRS